MPSLLFLHALSPLHAGTGHAIGAVDLPIARDQGTGFPYLPGSSIKGVLRDAATSAWHQQPGNVLSIFGPERDHASDHAGALLVGDGSLLLLPARSVAGTFAWVTSPWLLRRLARDAREAGLRPPPIPTPPTIGEAIVTKKSALLYANRVVFEDLDFATKQEESAATLADWLGGLLFPTVEPDHADWRNLLHQKLCILQDDAMAFFSEHGTDVVTRVAIDSNRKTVKDGALWTEESLPTETVLVSLLAAQSNGKVAANQVLARVLPLLARPLQFGGNASVGRGRCRLVLGGGQ